MLVLVATVGATLAIVSQVWATQAQRAREAELLAIGAEFRAAIASYARLSPRGQSSLPTSLDSLVLDKRFPQPVRHLRRIYRDPFTGEADWGLVKLGNGISGVFSKSTVVPLRKTRFPPWAAGFDKANTVADWQFIADLRGPAAPPPPALPPGTPRPGDPGTSPAR